MSSPVKKRTPKKLSESEKGDLRRDYNDGSYSQTALSDKYGCSKSSVQRIIKNSESNDREQPVYARKYFE